MVKSWRPKHLSTDPTRGSDWSTITSFGRPTPTPSSFKTGNRLKIGVRWSKNYIQWLTWPLSIEWFLSIDFWWCHQIPYRVSGLVSHPRQWSEVLNATGAKRFWHFDPSDVQRLAVLTQHPWLPTEEQLSSFALLDPKLQPIPWPGNRFFVNWGHFNGHQARDDK